MSYLDGLMEEDEEGIDGLGTPKPVDTVAGPMTPNQAVYDRIKSIKQGASSPNETASAQEASPIGLPSGGNPDDLAAMEFARGSASAASLGRAFNSVAAGFGAKVDNGGYEAMERNATGLANKAMDRSSRVAQAIEARKGKEAALARQLENDKKGEEWKQKNYAQKDEELHQRRLDRKDAQDDRSFQRDQVRTDKLEREAKLSDKQIEAFSDLDNAKADLNNLLGQLGKNSNWTGSFDGRVPDALVGADQVAWRSALGKYKDAYRKAITGAGAGPGEIAILESRLPSATDTYDNFVSKSNEALKELQARKSVLSSNLEKGGKNVANFRDPVTQPQGPIAGGGVPGVGEANGGKQKNDMPPGTKKVGNKTYRKVQGGWEEI